MVNKKNIIFAVIAMIAMMSMTGCPAGTDVSNVGGTVGIESLDAPVIKTVDYDYGIYLTWAPVTDATMYYVYRAEKDEKGKFGADKLMPVYGNNEFVDNVSLDADSIKDGSTYKYTVVAKTNKKSLSDSKATKTVKFTAKLAKDAKVPAAENVKAEYKDGSIVLTCDAPEYLTKDYYTNAYIKFESIATGLPEEYIDAISSSYNYPLSYNSYDDTFVGPAMAGQKMKLFVTTSYWNDYYAENTVETEVEVPAAGVDVPNFTLTDNDKGIEITFNDTIGGTYKLYRAVYGGAYTFSEVTATPTKEDYKCDDIDGITYTYLDNTVEMGEGYVYVLTGTLDGKAMNSKNKSEGHDVYPYADPEFKAYKYTGADNSNDVRLSWRVQEGYTYELVRCLIGGGDHVESEVTIGTYTGKINNIKVVTDTLPKTKNSSYSYKYTLIGTKAGQEMFKITTQNSFNCYDFVANPKNYYRFRLTDIVEKEDADWYQDGTVDITIEVASVYKNITFYRAVLQENSYTYDDEYVEEYKVISPVLDMDNSSDQGDYKVFHYLDKTATVEGIYEYSVKAVYNDETVDIDLVYYRAYINNLRP